MRVRVGRHGSPRPGFSTPTGRNRPWFQAGTDPTVASFVDPTVSINGPAYVKIGQNSFVAPFAQLKAGKKGTLVIGNGSDVQDNATSTRRPARDHRRLGSRRARRDDRRPGHDRQVQRAPDEERGDLRRVHQLQRLDREPVIDPPRQRAGQGDEGCDIPAGFQVLPGQLVQNQADLADTTKVAPLTLSLEEFEVGVFDVNQNFALGYTSLYDISPNSVRGIGFDPSDMVDPTNPGSVVPIIGLNFTHISLLTEVLTVINLAAILNNTVHFFELSNELNENTITFEKIGFPEVFEHSLRVACGTNAIPNKDIRFFRC